MLNPTFIQTLCFVGLAKVRLGDELGEEEREGYAGSSGSLTLIIILLIEPNTLLFFFCKSYIYWTCFSSVSNVSAIICTILALVIGSDDLIFTVVLK